MESEKDKNPTFEQGLSQLEQLIEELEGEDLNLDRSLKVFEEGIKLTRMLNRKLDEAEKKLELLVADENGEPAVHDFDIRMDEE